MINDRSLGATGTNLGSSRSRSRHQKTKSLSPYRPSNNNSNVMTPSEYHTNRRKRLERAKAVVAQTRRAAQASHSNQSQPVLKRRINPPASIMTDTSKPAAGASETRSNDSADVDESEISVLSMGTAGRPFWGWDPKKKSPSSSSTPSSSPPKNGGTGNVSGKLDRHLAKKSSNPYLKGGNKTTQKPPNPKHSKKGQDESSMDMDMDALAYGQDHESFESIIPPPPPPPPVTPERSAQAPSVNQKVFKSPSASSVPNSQELLRLRSASTNLVDSVDLLNYLQSTERAHFTSSADNTDHPSKTTKKGSDDKDENAIQASTPPEIKRDLVVADFFPLAVAPQGLAQALSKIEEEQIGENHQHKVDGQVVKNQEDNSNLGKDPPEETQAKIQVSPDRSLATQETYTSTVVGSPFRTPTSSPKNTPAHSVSSDNSPSKDPKNKLFGLNKIKPRVSFSKKKTNEKEGNEEEIKTGRSGNSSPSKMVVLLTPSAQNDIKADNLGALLDQNTTEAMTKQTNMSGKLGEGSSTKYYDFTEELLIIDKVVDKTDNAVQHSNGIDSSSNVGKSFLDSLRCRFLDSMCVCPSESVAPFTIVTEDKDSLIGLDDHESCAPSAPPQPKSILRNSSFRTTGFKSGDD